MGSITLFALVTGAAALAQTASPPPAPPVPTVPAPTATLAPQILPSVPPPTPVPTAKPSPTPTPAPPQRGRRAEPAGTPNPDASETPAPPTFTTLDGIWEVEEQPLNAKQTIYTHLNLVQTGSDVTGYWEHGNKKTRSQLKGSFDGRLISLQVDVGGGKVASFSGYVENFTDMVGLLRQTETDAGTAFTGQHRKKERL